MQAALGILCWPPPVFWAATPHELMAAIEGVEVQTPHDRGQRRPAGRRRTPLTRSEFDDLRARFPDGKS